MLQSICHGDHKFHAFVCIGLVKLVYLNRMIAAVAAAAAAVVVVAVLLFAQNNP